MSAWKVITSTSKLEAGISVIKCIVYYMYVCLDRFSADENFKNSFRISYSFYKPDTLKFAAEKIAAVIKKHL